FVASVRSSQTFGGVIPDCCACYFFYHAKLLAIIFVDKMWLDGRIRCGYCILSLCDVKSISANSSQPL
ncbi:MAG TPA: hypothetical protein VIJ75_07025, partial [Hanamia sp.]